jgi:hypothetical protein
MKGLRRVFHGSLQAVLQSGKEITNMRDVSIKHAVFATGLILVLAVLALEADICSAQEKQLRLPAYYPETFSGQGCIDRITADKVVIDDRLFKFSSDVTFHTPEMENVSRSRLRPGSRVGFVKNSDNKVVSLWYLQSCK